MSNTMTVEGNKLIVELNQMGYSILSDGRCIGKDGRILKTKKGTTGYYQLNTYHSGKKKTFLIHRLVASAFIPNPNNLPEVNHKDGNKGNNHFTNLEWVSRSANIKHGIDTGLIKKSMIERTGKRHFRSIPVIMYNINGEAITFESTGDAARKTGLSAKSIQDACSGKLKTYKGLKWKYIR